MEFYTSSLMLLATANVYATKTNKLKNLEVCKIAENTFKKYTMEEFIAFKSEDTHIGENPGTTLKEKISFLYILIKEKLNKNDDVRLFELNEILKSLSESEEDELIDVITMTITRPGEILFQINTI